MNKDEVIKALEKINKTLGELMFEAKEFEVSDKIVRLSIKVDETIKDIAILK